MKKSLGSRIQFLNDMKKHLFIFIIILISIMFLLQIDDNLSLEAQTMLDLKPWQKSSEAYMYLTAMGVAENKDPSVEGERIIVELRDHEQDSFKEYLEAINSNDTKVRIKWAIEDAFSFPKKLKLPKHNCCFYDQKNALRAAVTDDVEYDLSNSAYDIYEQRYYDFLKLDDFHTMKVPSPEMQDVEFSYLTIGNIISLYKIIEEAKKNPVLAVEKLYELIYLQYRFIGKTDDLITRIISYKHFNESINVLSLLLKKYEVKGKPLALLTNKQLDFSKIINREFIYAEKSLSIGFRKSLPFMKSYQIRIPNWVTRTILKRNMYLNEIVLSDQKVILLSKDSQSSFANNINQSANTSIFSIRNFLGVKLIRERHATYLQHIGQGFDINAKITFFNTILGKTITPRLVESLQNPYFSSTGHASLHEEERLICFDGPIEDKKNYRCLPY